MSKLLLNPAIPALCAFLAAFMASYVLTEFLTFAMTRYRDRYLQEASLELDDVLLQLPAGRILDFSLGICALGFLMSVLGFATISDRFSWGKGVAIGLMVAVMLFPAPRLYLRFLKKQRLAKFNEQLEDALGSIASSLKAGFSINQALESIAEENKHPISVEFRLLVQELRLGVPLEQALENVNRRLGSDDFELVATAIITARQTGGELTATLERLAAVIRERCRIQNKLKAITAQGKLQAWVIGAMPFGLLFAMSYAAPQMMDAFFGSIYGYLAIGVVSVLVITGFLVIRRITTIDI